MKPTEKTLTAKVLGREESIFRADIETHATALTEAVAKARVLVIGAAGSVGSAFVKQIVDYAPAALHLIDPNENTLVEIVRDLKASSCLVPEDFKTLAIAMGSDGFHSWLNAEFDYDYVINFAALKHVRSERDPYTAMRMFDTNVVAVKKLLDALGHRNIEKFFSVSSDKAVKSANMMGATKTLMERVMWSAVLDAMT